MVPDKIDLVYMWVDGNDKNWQASKNYWLKEIKNETIVPSDSVTAARWRDNDELKYSLRSVEMFAPWINHIYIVTGFNQIPSWLNTKNPKITIISQEQIMPTDALPTFNSVAIEMCLMNIPNLSEHFLLANDDMFFNKPTSPDFFYDKNGNAIVWYIKHKKDMPIGFALESVQSDYRKTILMAAHKIESLFGKKCLKYTPSHNIDPYIKSSMIAAKNHPMLIRDIDAQVRNKFRTNWELQRWVFNLYDFVHGFAKFKRLRNFKKPKHFIHNLIHYKDCKNAPTYITNTLTAIPRSTAQLFCINDVAGITEDIRKSNHEFLEKKFPKKSSFEK